MIPTSNLAVAEWIKSSHSGGNGGNCVEYSPSYARTHRAVPVRDTKEPQGPALVFPAAGWSAFVAAVRDGRLPV